MAARIPGARSQAPALPRLATPAAGTDHRLPYIAGCHLELGDLVTVDGHHRDAHRVPALQVRIPVDVDEPNHRPARLAACQHLGSAAQTAALAGVDHHLGRPTPSQQPHTRPDQPDARSRSSPRRSLPVAVCGRTGTTSMLVGHL